MDFTSLLKRMEDLEQIVAIVDRGNNLRLNVKVRLLANLVGSYHKILITISHTSSLTKLLFFPPTSTDLDQRCKGVPSTNWGCCSKARKCNLGGGDCDRDDDCAGNLKCGSDNCRKDFSSTGSNWSDSADCCFGK